LFTLDYWTTTSQSHSARRKDDKRDAERCQSQNVVALAGAKAKATAKASSRAALIRFQLAHRKRDIYR